MFRNNERTKAYQGMYATELFRREVLRFVRENYKKTFLLYLFYSTVTLLARLRG